MFGTEFDPQAQELSGLSPLEREIWHEKQRSGSNLEVALKLFLSEDAVKRHLQSISQKLEGWSRRHRLLNGRI